MSDTFTLRPLKDVLWEAQSHRCWLCQREMRYGGVKHDSATIDHVWPKSIYGRIGDIGVTLLACRSCNSARPPSRPTDDEIRAVIRIWRRVDKSWMRATLALIQKNLESFERVKARAGILEEFTAA